MNRAMLATHFRQASAMAGEDLLAALLARTAAGDEKAFRALYDRSAPRLFAVILRIVRERGAAETVLQQAYARIFARACEFDPAHDALAWMVAMARLEAIAAARTGPRELSFAPAGDFGNPPPCFAQIAEPARRALLLAYREGLSYEELGAVFGVPTATARAWVCDALARMRQNLDRSR
jgi:RNA polymerase sigma-70 factor (ECF subfamily)